MNGTQGDFFAPIQQALRLGNREIMSFLFDKPELILGTNDKDVHLYISSAIDTGDPEIVQMFLKPSSSEKERC